MLSGPTEALRTVGSLFEPESISCVNVIYSWTAVKSVTSATSNHCADMIDLEHQNPLDLDARLHSSVPEM